MVLSTENILLIGSILLFISIIAGKTSYKFGVPILLLFLTVGMLAGSEGIGGIYFNNPKLSQFIGIVSLNFILFSGGLETQISAIKPVWKKGLALSTLGVLISAFLLGSFVHFITDFNFYESMLLGSIVSSTDAAAVFSILRSKNLALKNNIRPILELESGSNDPMAYALTIAFLSLVINPQQSVFTTIFFLLQQMALGALGGFAFGKFNQYIINHIRLDFEGLYPVLAIALMFFTFSVTDFLGGNGFLAIYLCSIYLGNNEIIHKRTIIKMFDGMAWLMQIVLFLTLGLLVFPSQIIPYFGTGMMISLFLIFIARPISVFLALSFFRLSWETLVFIGWVGFRGAVPIVFATYPLLAGISKANIIFNIVFFISVTSVLIQGTSLTLFAKWLQLGTPDPNKPLSELDHLFLDLPKPLLQEFTIEYKDFAANKKIVDLNFPKSAFIVMIKRNDEYIRPGGFTEIQPNDILMVLADSPDDFEAVKACLKQNKNLLI